MAVSFDPVTALMRPRLEAPEPTMEWAALEAARQFCTKARAYRDFVVLDLKAGYPTYTLVPNVFVLTDQDVEARDAVEVIGVESVEVDGIPYDPASPESTGRDSDGVYVYYPMDTVQIFKPPEADLVSGLRVRVVLRPKPMATGLPDRLTARFASEIATGAVALLKEMPEEAWSDPRGAALSGAMFEEFVSNERVKADLQYRHRALRTTVHS